MDERLGKRLQKIEEQIEELSKVEKMYLHLEAHKDALFSQLYLKATGKSVADREAEVYASSDWLKFAAGLAQAQQDYNEARRRYELRLKAYDAEHLSFKVENAAIMRQGG